MVNLTKRFISYKVTGSAPTPKMVKNGHFGSKNTTKRTWQHARIVFHRKSSSTEGYLPPKVVFRGRLSSPEGRLPQKVFFHRWVSSTEGRLPLKVVFHPRSSSTKGLLTSKVVFHRWSSFTYHNTLVDLLFVRTVNIPNLSLLPCLEVASPLKVVFHQRLSPTKKWDSKTGLRLVKKGAVRLVLKEVENGQISNFQTYSLRGQKLASETSLIRLQNGFVRLHPISISPYGKR